MRPTSEAVEQLEPVRRDDVMNDERTGDEDMHNALDVKNRVAFFELRIAHTR